MTMKKLFIFMTSLTVCFFIIFFAALREKTLATRENVTESLSSPLYTLKIYEGRLAVYRFEESAPIEVTDVYADSLPPYDKAALEKGIAIYSDEQLRKALEDYD